ncbi:hypothetical protein HDU76_007145 [Blyttiomyces sp. JEL0837]|nr:hypothetical protein HDU76_007145 [Blyttiomyces sp. JEL0837]
MSVNLFEDGTEDHLLTVLLAFYELAQSGKPLSYQNVEAHPEVQYAMKEGRDGPQSPPPSPPAQIPASTSQPFKLPAIMSTLMRLKMITVDDTSGLFMLPIEIQTQLGLDGRKIRTRSSSHYLDPNIYITTSRKPAVRSQSVTTRSSTRSSTTQKETTKTIAELRHELTLAEQERRTLLLQLDQLKQGLVSKLPSGEIKMIDPLLKSEDTWNRASSFVVQASSQRERGEEYCAIQ